MQRENNNYEYFEDKKLLALQIRLNKLIEKQKMEKLAVTEKQKAENFAAMVDPRSKVEELMWRNNMTTTQFKKAMGIDDATTARIVTGKTKSYQLDMLKMLCKVLKTTPSELYNFK